MLLILIFHQLGLLAIICCTGELCTTPLFMPITSSTLWEFYYKEEEIKKEREIFLFLFSPFLSWCSCLN
jgi:Golgi nucleoside diphosphatase